MPKRLFALPALAAALVAVTIGFASSPAHAKPKTEAAASPSPSPQASPTSTPEPLDRAVPRLEAKLKQDPNDKATLQELAGDYIQINRPDLALALTQKLLTGGTKTAQVYFTDGFAQLQLGRQKEALADFEMASNLEPTNPQVLAQLTDLYLRLNRASDAERIAKRAITFNKSDKNAYLAYGRVLVAERKYDDARAQFESAAKLDPKDPFPYNDEAITYVDQDAIALAGQYYDKALAIDPNNVDALLGRARVAANGHDVKGAIGYFERIQALQTDPAEKAAIVDLEAQVYASEKMTGDAEATYKKAIATYPTALNAHLSYGDYLAASGHPQQAEQEWNAARGANNDNAEAVARLGELYGQQKQYGKATDQFKRLATLAPNDPRAFLALGQLYTLQHQNDRARDSYRHAYEISRSPQALVGLGQADFASHNYPECAKIFDAFDRAAPQLVKQNPPILFVMGQCFANTNQKDKARSAYQRYLAAIGPNSAGASQVKKLIADLNRSNAKPQPQQKKK